ncbi:MAG: T9SS type A sorting domain-containing protein [Ignavibacteriaceae bacterium]
MKNKIIMFSFFFLILLSIDNIYAQRTPAQLEIGLDFFDDTNITFNGVVAFGLDPLATDGYDRLPYFFEDALPPWSPQLEVRFAVDIYESYTDIRYVSSFPYSGVDTLSLRWLLSAGASTLTMNYNLPAGVSIVISTLLGNSPILIDSGSYSLTNANIITQAALITNYNNITTDVEVENTSADHYNLSQNYPNPFNPSTKIKYSIANNLNVQLKIFDVLGKEITTLVSSEQPAGTYEVNFDGKELTSGIYFYTIKAGNYTETKSMILIK